MDTLKSTFSELGVPLAPDKVVGPVTQSTYLGIEIDSHALCVRLPNCFNCSFYYSLGAHERSVPKETCCLSSVRCPLHARL